MMHVFVTALYLERIGELVKEQATDDGLWFEAETVAEAYLQSELRKLHALIEKKHLSSVEGMPNDMRTWY